MQMGIAAGVQLRGIPYFMSSSSRLDEVDVDAFLWG